MEKFNLQYVHRLTGIVIASFFLLHVTNHLFVLAGPQAHISVMRIFRYVYRFPPIEVLLLLSVVVQVVSGIALFIKRGFQKNFYNTFQILSGLYLSFFLIYHVRAVLLGRYAWHVETDFYFAASVANQYPSKLFFIPYYTLSLLAVFIHIGCIHHQKMVSINMRSVDPVFSLQAINTQTRLIFLIGFLITTVVMLGLSGVLFPIS